MSTKTTFKRIALVAVAALTLGSFSAVSASATAGTSLPFGVSAASYAPADSYAATVAVSQVAGANNYVELTAGSDSASAVIVKVSGGTVSALTQAAGTTPAVATLNASATEISYSSTNIFDTTNAAFKVSTPSAGSITVTVVTRAFANGVATDTTLQTFTVTVTSAATAGVLSVTNSTSLLDNAGLSAGSYTAPTADEAVSAAKSAGTAAGVALLTLKDVNAVVMPDSTSVTAVVTGPGTVSLNSTLASATYATGGRVDSGTTASGLIYAAFYADGTSGVSIITFSVGTTVVATETVTFYGAATKLTATAVKYSLADDASATAFVSISATDANGVAVPVAAADGAPTTTTNGVFTDADGATAFAVSVLLDPAADTRGVKTTTWTHTATALTIDVSVVVAEALATGTQVTTLSLDKTEYNAGEKITVTIKSVDAYGNIMADGVGNYLTSANVTSTASLVGTLPAQSVTLANGVATYTLYAALVPGPVTLSGVSAATAATALSATFTVLSDGVAQAAADAAAEATDAANAATDAANAAAEAADAATAAAQDAADAVAALSVAVTEMVSALKKQITALTNLVIKIQKKVKA